MFLPPLEWPFDRKADGSWMWSHLPYEERMKEIAKWANACYSYIT